MSALQTLTQNLAKTLNMGDGTGLIETLKATAFKSQISVSDDQMTALMVVANQYGLNPWTKEIYAFPDKGGIVPIVGVDGWARIINSHSQFDGMDFEQDADSCTCIIHRKDRGHPIKVTEWMSECRRENATPWKSHPKRMLRHKAMIQCARLAFGFVGIYDEDEAQRIKESSSGGEIVEAVVKEKPEYSAEAFNKNKDSWQKLIDSGKKTPDEIINAVETKATMTEPQKNVVLNMKKEAINENS